MKSLKTAALLVAVLSSALMAADRKEADKVILDELVKDTQRNAVAQNADGRQGMYFVWYVPVEFWQSSLLQNPTLPKAQANQTIDQLKGTIIVAVARAEINETGAFKFFDEATVHKNLSLEYAGADGKPTTLKEQADLSPTAAAIIAAMKPGLRASMGNMGQNTHFFVFNDGGEGKRIAPPDAPGTLTAVLAPLPGEKGGRVDIAFPLNSLFVPRTCAKCHHEGMNIQWGFCPYCGGKLAD